jgi:outer membrane immunogenic protein
MIKTIFTLFFLCFITISTFAQLTGGFKAGLNIAQVRSEFDGDSESSDMSVGFLLGGYLNIPMSEITSFQPELIFSRVGGKDSAYDPDLGGDLSVTLKADYLSVPLLARFKAGENFNFLAGPQVGLLVGAKAKIEIQGQSITVDAKDGYKTFDFGLTGGIGYSKNKFAIDARYYFGMLNIVDESSDPDLEGSKAMNRVITIGVSYKMFEK